jgi:hypothetical protein
MNALLTLISIGCTIKIESGNYITMNHNRITITICLDEVTEQTVQEAFETLIEYHTNLTPGN